MKQFKFVILAMIALICVPTISPAQDCAIDLIKHVEEQNVQELRLAIENGCHDFEQRDAQGDTAVLMAARKGDLVALEILVLAGANVNALDVKRRDVLNIAISNKNTALARNALELGSDPTLVTSIYDGGAIIYGSAKGEVAIVEMLLKAGAPVNRINNLGWTALLEVAILGDGSERYQRIATALIDAGADRSIEDKHGRTPYDHAVSQGNQILARILRQN
jgi:ankyrin repeat protein